MVAHAPTATTTSDGNKFLPAWLTSAASWLIPIFLGIVFIGLVIMPLLHHGGKSVKPTETPAASSAPVVQSQGQVTQVAAASSEVTALPQLTVPGSDQGDQYSQVVEQGPGEQICREALNVRIKYRPVEFHDDAPEHWFAAAGTAQVHANAYVYQGLEPGTHTMKVCKVADTAACPHECP